MVSHLIPYFRAIRSIPLKEDSLLDKGIIVSCDQEPGEFISPIFTVPKKDGNVRLILKLKHLNLFIKNSHFKMDTIAKRTITKNRLQMIISPRGSHNISVF